MSNPPFVNSPPPRRGLGCWPIGGITCLVVFILGALVIAGMGYSYLHSAAGHKADSMIGSVVQKGEEIKNCGEKMRAVRAAIIRYHISKGVYPKDLSVLVPEYLANPTVLHCPLDAAKDPKHVTFVYTRPGEGAPPNTPLLSFTTSIAFTFGDQTQTSEMTLVMTLGGQVLQSQKVIQNGKVISQTPLR